MYRFIYITTNLINNKKYIGKHSTENLDDGYLGSGKVIKYAINKYGSENFKRQIIQFANSIEGLNELEKFYIAKFKACSNPNFYNIHIGGNGGNTIMGYTQQQYLEFIKKMSEVSSGENNGMYGKKHNENSIKMMSEIRKQHFDKISNTELQKFKITMSKVTSGEKNGMFGKSHTIQSKKKISEHRKGKTLGEKNGMYNKKGQNAINGQKVYMYDLEWNIIREFPSIKEALKFLGVKGHVSLIKACKQKIPYKGYYWEKEFSVRVNK